MLSAYRIPFSFLSGRKEKGKHGALFSDCLMPTEMPYRLEAPLR